MAELTNAEREDVCICGELAAITDDHIDVAAVCERNYAAVARIKADAERAAVERVVGLLGDEAVVEASALGMWTNRGEAAPLPPEPAFLGKYYRQDARAALAAAAAEVTRRLAEEAGDVPNDGENDG